MKLSIAWVLARLALLLLTVVSLAGFTQFDTNIDPLGGLVCGGVLFFFVLYTVTKKSDEREEMFSLTSPFFPPWKNVQAYWFTVGAILFLSSLTNLIFHLGNPNATNLYGGLTLLTAGIVAGAVFARYKLNKT